MTEDKKFGGYTKWSCYREMCLKMILTGTNAPDEETWSKALGVLIDMFSDMSISEVFHEKFSAND